MPSFQNIQFKYIYNNLLKNLIKSRFPMKLVPRIQDEILEYTASASTKT